MPDLLAEEAAQVRAFLALLETEQQALSAGDVDRLLALAADKNAHFARLSQLGEARGRMLTAAGCGADRQGQEQWLRQNPGQAGARKAWGELLALAEQARAANQTNGQLIAIRLAHNQQALSALMAAANQASLYGPDGQARPLGSGRSLGSV